MRARHRHFNPRDIGPTMVLDSRYMTGTNGVAVDSWKNRANSSNNATSTGTQRPIFETNSLNGNSGVKFDGINDLLDWTGIQMRFGMCVFKASGNQPQYGSMWGNNGPNDNFSAQHYFSQAGDAWIDNAFGIPRWKDGTWQKNGVNFTATTAGSLTTNTDIVSILLTDNGGREVSKMCDRGNTARVVFGILYQYQISPNDTSLSVRRRLQHAAAYSFKIACS